jgi:guanylate kinase
MNIGEKSQSNSPRGKLVIISGPSGVGKSTCVRQLLKQCGLPLELSVSATTRPIRPGETNGKEYNFMSLKEFERLESEGAFLETAEVFGVGHKYGTLHSVVTSGLDEGKWIILEIDVIGAAEVLKQYPETISIFIYQSIEEIEKRLRGRNTEPEEVIQRRLAVASSELEVKDIYLHQVINHTVEHTADQICQLLQEACPDCQESNSKAESEN